MKLTPFYIVKLGFTGVYIIFLISAQKHRLWVLVRTASLSTHNLCFEQKYEKLQRFLSGIFQFLKVKFSTYLHRHVFLMAQTSLHVRAVCSGSLALCLQNRWILLNVLKYWTEPYHYENTPIQIYRKFHLQKTEIFQVKISFSYFCSKT